LSFLLQFVDSGHLITDSLLSFLYFFGLRLLSLQVFFMLLLDFFDVLQSVL